MLTNVYAPTLRDEKHAFLAELVEVAEAVHGAWMILGYFNLTRCSADKDNDSFNALDADHFNDLINSLALIEIPLVDCAYTWSNRRENPTLVHLERCFVNLVWDESFPNTALSFLTLCLYIPRSVCFRFENAWLLNRQFPRQCRRLSANLLPVTLPRVSCSARNTAGALANLGLDAGFLWINGSRTPKC